MSTIQQQKIEKVEVYNKWKSLVNMTKSELEKFYHSEEGKEAGLSSSKAKSLGIHSGRESARWIMKMKDTSHDKWTNTMWEWANRQISFISRMRGNKGGLYDEEGNKTRKHTSLLIWGHNPEKFVIGGSLSKTHSPKLDRVYGSDVNPENSSKDLKSSKQIKFDAATLKSIQNKVKEHNKDYPSKKITIEAAKAVVRRGMGAYSVTHRPTIKGGKPNSRVAWGLARLNAFIYKLVHGKSKSGKYSQDNDFIDELHIPHKKFASGGSFDNDVKEIAYFGSPIYREKGELMPAKGGELGAGLYFTRNYKLAENYSLPRGEVFSMSSANSKSGVAELYLSDIKINKLTKDEYLNKRSEFYNAEQKLNNGNWSLDIANAAERKLINYFQINGYDGLEVVEEEQGVIFPSSVQKVKHKLVEYEIKNIMAAGGRVSSSRLLIPNVRGGWTKDKIIKYFKANSSDTISTMTLMKYISYFENWQQFKNHIYYHGTTHYIDKGLKPSIVFSEKQAERQGGGGYGQRYFGISLTKRKRTAENFSGDRDYVEIYPVILKRDAKVIERLDLSDASEIEDIIVELYNEGVDAVWIGGGEEELVVVNPFSILLYPKGSEQYRVFGGFKSVPITDERIKELYDNSATLYKEYKEKFDAAKGNEEKNKALRSFPSVKFEKGGLIAPNGKESNLTPEQYKLVRTPEFKVWFGDWENDPENASKVIDENGEPLVVYHFTDKQFNKFELKGLSKGFFFTENKNDDEFSYDGVTYYIDKGEYPIWIKELLKKGLSIEEIRAEVNETQYQKAKAFFLNIRKMYPSSWVGEVSDKNWSVPYFENLHIDKARERNFNGIEFIRGKDKKRIIVALEPEQIKLADGTNTTFDSSNPDIRYENGGEIYYHGSDKGINIESGEFKPIFFTKHKEYAGQYGSKIVKYKLAINKPFDTSNDLSALKIYNDIFIPFALNKSNGDKRFKLLKDGESVTFLTADLLWLFLRKSKREGNDYGYDSIIVDEGGFEMSDKSKMSFVPLNISQVEKYENGGITKKDLQCENCGQKFTLSENDKYICPNCNYDNETAYIMSALKPTKTLEEISYLHNVPKQQLELQLQKGILTEMEHTTDERIATTIALHHLEEMPDYYDKLSKIEKSEFKRGGVADCGCGNNMKYEEGGVFCGERFLIKSTGQVVALEGGEGIMSPKTMQSERLFIFEGKKMTGREVSSHLNHKYGGVEFANGGEVSHVCGCRQFSNSGELPTETIDYLEGGEGLICIEAMESKNKYSFNGSNYTPRQILSQINIASGGNKFEEGGIIDLKKYKLKMSSKLAKMVFFAEKLLHLI